MFAEMRDAFVTGRTQSPPTDCDGRARERLDGRAVTSRETPRFDRSSLYQAPSLATRWLRRETLRLAALAWTMPFCADRMIAGSASFSAASALPRSPAAIASLTLRTKLRNLERLPLLISVRRAILRVALRAELVLAILSARCRDGAVQARSMSSG